MIREKRSDICKIDCEDRHEGCHSGCVRYVAFSLAREKELEMYREAKEKRDAYKNYQHDTRTKNLRRKRNKESR